MSDIRPDEYMVIYDEELGAAYGARKGIVKPTAPGHAQAIENCLQQYFEGKMSNFRKGLIYENFITQGKVAVDTDLCHVYGDVRSECRRGILIRENTRMRGIGQSDWCGAVVPD